jgi:hypothetical protein
MRAAVRTAVALAILTGVLLPAGPVYADDPSISIDDVTIAPGGPSRFYQPINYHNLPANTDIHVSFPSEFSGYGPIFAEGSYCGSFSGLPNTCNTSGSGTVLVRYIGGDIGSDLYLNSPSGSKVFAVAVTVPSLGLSATGKITLAPKADLMVKLDSPSFTSLKIRVFNLGPSYLAGETLTISGLPAGRAITVFVPGIMQCNGAGPGVSCSFPSLAIASGPDVDCYNRTGPPLCVQADISADAPGLPITISVSGSFADPNTSNNAVAAVLPGSNVAVAQPPTPTSNQQGGTSNLPVYGPTESGTPAAQPSTVDPGSSAPAVGTAPEPAAAVVPRQTGPGLLPWIAAAAIALLLAAGMPAGLHLLARRRTRTATPISRADASSEASVSDG